MSKQRTSQRHLLTLQSAAPTATPTAPSPQATPRVGVGGKIFFGLCVLWVQLLFFGLVWGMDSLLHWGLALFFVMIGAGFVGLGISWSTAEHPAPQPTTDDRPEPAPLPPLPALEKVSAAPSAYCLVCDEQTGRVTSRPRQCLACGFEPSTESPGEALLQASDGLRELRQWQQTLEQWLEGPSQDTAMQVYQCSAALVAIVSRFPCLKEVSQASPGAAEPTAVDGLYTTPSERTWGDAELVLDEIYAAQEKTQVDVAGGSQRGLLQQALLYTRQLKARQQKHIRELNYCADELLELDTPQEPLAVSC